MSNEITPRVRAVLDWFLLNRELGDIDALFQAACARLDAAGFPIDRVSLNLEVIHPEVGGERRVWQRAGGLEVTRAAQGVELSEDYLLSPVKVVDDTDRPFRRLLDGTPTGMSLLDRLQGEGFTDYLIVPLAFQDKDRSAAMSFATRRPGGFAAPDLAELLVIVQGLCPAIEARVMRIIGRDLLTTYLGRDPGERVLRGQIRRGDVSSLFAAILFCDLRNFTGFTQDNPSQAVIRRLNDWFGIAVEAVEGNGGEVLKFMGDGAMAIFPAEELNPRQACGHALAAASAIGVGADAWNAARDPHLPALDYGLSLHLGYVAFGNIGGARRLDFTVIGPAVNLASRLMEVAKHLDRRVVVSQSFAGCSGRNHEPLGDFTLRGIGHPVPVYAPG